MKEIGGYFGLEQFIHREYYASLIALNSGRNCLAYLIKARSIKKLYIPYFLCQAVKRVCEINGCEVEEYHINSDLKSIFDKELSVGEYLYLVNYYSQIDNSEIIALKNQYKNIIFDNAQAFFQRPVNGIDTLYTCRKFFGVPDGAYLSTDKELDVKLETDISITRMTHILGCYEGTASDYYKRYQKCENSFNNLPLKYMSNLTHNMLGAIDYERVSEIRNKNFEYLASKLGTKNKLKLKKTNGAFAYPFYIENGDEIRQKFIKHKIHVATLWKNVQKNTPKAWIEYDYAVNILPLPCDQRYQPKDMDFIINILLNST